MDSDAGVDPVELVPALPVLEVVSSLALPDLLDDRDAFSDFTDFTDLALRSALDDFDSNSPSTQALSYLLYAQYSLLLHRLFFDSFLHGIRPRRFLALIPSEDCILSSAVEHGV